jgi:hypothetical protein
MADTGQQLSGANGHGHPLSVTSIINPRERLSSRDWVRGMLALSLLFILLLEVASAIGFVFFCSRLSDDKSITAAKDIITLVLNPTVALVGAATGFYYGASDARR